jgi:tripartite ATP-independent transporter DctM subunit
MEWWEVFTFFIGGLVFLLVIGFPIAFAFLLMDIVGVIVFMGSRGVLQLPLQIFSSLSTFTLSPIPMFILMGELMFHSGVAYRTIDVLDKWLGRLPGRLSLLAAAGGTLFSALSGSTLANTAMLGTVLLPDMQKRGYKPAMSVGPIVGVGGLAMLVPPSSLAVVLAALGHISVSKILVGGVLPGLMLGGMFALYIVLRCWMNPALAPRYEVSHTSIQERLVMFLRYVMPLGIVIFAVLGLMMLGLATPTEAAASGVLGTVLVVALFRKLTFDALKKSIIGTLEITIMIFMIIAASNAFSAILAFSGATTGLLGVIGDLNLPPLMILVGMQLMVFLLGMFMETISIMMICLPIFMPIVKLLGFDPVWFGVLMLINFEMGLITPPFGMLLFVMKGVAPKEITIEDICWAALPFIVCDAVVMALVISMPSIALWLPSLL